MINGRASHNTCTKLMIMIFANNNFNNRMPWLNSKMIELMVATTCELFLFCVHLNFKIPTN